MLRIPRPLVPAFAVVLGVLACSEDTTVPVTNDIGGDWIFAERLTASSVGLVCDDTAYVHVEQDGEAFSVNGSQFGSCRIGDEEFPNDGTVAITNGRIGGDGSVSFSFADCSYTGRIAEGDQRANGMGQCTIAMAIGTIVVSSTWSMRRGDFRPPVVSAMVSGVPVSHGDTFTVSVQATEDGALALLGQRVTWDRALDPECPVSALPEADSAAVSGTSAGRTTRYVVPPCTALAFIHAFAVDTAGNRAEVELDFIPVVLPSSEVTGALGDTLYTLGDTVTVGVSATNARGLGWIGYAWNHADSGGRDSVAVTGVSASENLTFVIPETDYPHLLYTRVFARHTLGWLTEVEIESARTTDADILPVERLELPGERGDAAYHPAQDRLHVLDASQAVVREVTLAPFAAGVVRDLPGTGLSLDFSLGDDTLLVTLRDAMTVAAIPLDGSASTTIELTPPDTINIYDARWLRVAAHGRALVAVGSGSGAVVLDLDPGTGAQSVRLPSWDGYGRSERTPDRSRVLFMGSGSPVTSRLYLAGTDEFLAEESGKVSGGSVSADDPATTWLVGRQLLSAYMTPLLTLSDPSVDWGPSAISPDGTRAWVGRSDGVVEFDVATGARLRAIWLPAAPEWMRALPGGRLLAASGSTLYLVTLE